MCELIQNCFKLESGGRSQMKKNINITRNSQGHNWWAQFYCHSQGKPVVFAGIEPAILGEEAQHLCIVLFTTLLTYSDDHWHPKWYLVSPTNCFHFQSSVSFSLTLIFFMYMATWFFLFFIWRSGDFLQIVFLLHTYYLIYSKYK